jgi:integrase
VQGYASKEAKHIDDKRRADGIQTRTGAKKAETVTIPEDIAQALKQQPETGQGRRDALIRCLLLDHGLRVEEVAILTEQLSETSATRAINKRVELLGRHAGVEGLSPHDCRHYAAIFEARKNTPVDRLVDMFGWNSPAMAFRYVEAAHIANDGTARVKHT